ncbi:hypothetical protein BC830DRAFT_1218039 [Chytriomyces sp. MP71]|nr:hypothetical protein BC830DRAFT_1218039 [Chytriomyces sp. MP71]
MYMNLLVKLNLNCGVDANCVLTPLKLTLPSVTSPHWQPLVEYLTPSSLQFMVHGLILIAPKILTILSLSDTTMASAFASRLWSALSRTHIFRGKNSTLAQPLTSGEAASCFLGHAREAPFTNPPVAVRGAGSRADARSLDPISGDFATKDMRRHVKDLETPVSGLDEKESPERKERRRVAVLPALRWYDSPYHVVICVDSVSEKLIFAYVDAIKGEHAK